MSDPVTISSISERHLGGSLWDFVSSDDIDGETVDAIEASVEASFANFLFTNLPSAWGQDKIDGLFVRFLEERVLPDEVVEFYDKTLPKWRPPSTKEVKAWADAQGIEYPARGRLPKEVTAAYDAAH